MTDAAQADFGKIADAYIALWNETDAKRRLALIGEAWTEDARYVDPLMSGEGREQISGLIGAVHERFPGFRFSLIGQPDGHGSHVRFSWGLGPVGQDSPIRGTDFAVVEGERLQSVTGFLDQVPAGA
ncbi:MAG TPA: nuclear transport factor 2 family protein [Caulobacteraceae bacterium]|jgi:plasmid stabilization system protein ParE|nr:nuclear transport factor 2 family protein [Caulobacteraceae bacterium]